MLVFSDIGVENFFFRGIIRNMQKFFLSFFLFILLGAGCSSKPAAEDQPAGVNKVDTPVVSLPPMDNSFPGPLPLEEITNKRVRISTVKGDVVFELFSETAPLAVSNFISLTNRGYYNGLTFHRREEGFVIQGGDPNGDGTGGPGYAFADELNDTYTYNRGMVAMANRGPDTNGSQFFVMLADYPLPKNYTIFGRVVSGIEVVDAERVGDVMQAVTIESF
jgi:cyclophilin family peptidyl-prolyl cis-trans isomerase